MPVIHAAPRNVPPDTVRFPSIMIGWVPRNVPPSTDMSPLTVSMGPMKIESVPA